MKLKIKRLDALIIAITLCLAVVLGFVIAAKVTPEKAQKDDTLLYTLSGESVTDTQADLKTEQTYLMDASWEDMRFILSGVEYRLPLDVSELEAHGWTGFTDENVASGEEASFDAFNGGAAINGTLYNPSDSDQSARACKVTAISFSWANGILPQNIQIMKSTVDDVYERYGEPLSASPELRSITYESVDFNAGFEALIDENRPGVLFFYNEDGVIVFAKLYCGQI